MLLDCDQSNVLLARIIFFVFFQVFFRTFWLVLEARHLFETRLI